jgi:Aspartyl protease
MQKTTSPNLSVTTALTPHTMVVFDPSSTNWQAYRDRVLMYFLANGVTDDSTRKYSFLCFVGDSTYHLLNSLVTPRSLMSEDVPFNDLIKLLDTHYDHKTNMMAATYDFFTCRQKPGQPFAEWKVELTNKLRDCGYTTSILHQKPYDRALRDAYVMGVHSPKIRQALLKELDPKLDTVENIIRTAEQLEADIRRFDPTNSATSSVAKIQRPPAHRKFTASSQQNTCATCGSTEHARSNCRYKDFACNYCHRKGHLERVCFSKRPGTKSTQSKRPVYHLYNIVPSSARSLCLTQVPLCVNGANINFELDTGAEYTIVSSTAWKTLGAPTLQASSIQLQCYSRQQIKRDSMRPPPNEVAEKF